MPTYKVYVRVPAWYYAEVEIDAPTGNDAETLVEERVRSGQLRLDQAWNYYDKPEVEEAEAYNFDEVRR